MPEREINCGHSCQRDPGLTFPFQFGKTDPSDINCSVCDDIASLNTKYEPKAHFQT